MTIKEKFKVGTKVKLTKVLHGLPKGSTGVVTQHLTCSPSIAVKFDDSGLTYNCYGNELELIIITIKELNNEKRSLLDKIDEINSKIAFMEDNAIDEFDEQAFTIFQIMEEVEKGDKSYKTAVKISKILNK